MMIIPEKPATIIFLRLTPPRAKRIPTSIIHKRAKKITPINLDKSPLFSELFCFIGANLIIFSEFLIIFAFIFIYFLTILRLNE